MWSVEISNIAVPDVQLRRKYTDPASAGFLLMAGECPAFTGGYLPGVSSITKRGTQ